MELRRSGPIQIAEFDCHGCEGLSTLADPRCRRCVFEDLGREEVVDRVVLGRSYQRVYDSPELSELARALVALKPRVHDRTLYASSEEREECRRCVDRRMEKLVELWEKLLENPHDRSSIERLMSEERRQKGVCAECTSNYFIKLVGSIRATLERVPVYGRLTPRNYDEVFEARVKPFFVPGVWHPPRRKVKLLDSYLLPEDRGQVLIYEQLDRPVRFYELELPEFSLPAEQLTLLDQAFRLELEGAPGHARFARPSRMLGFAEDWYNTLLHIIRERSDLRISSDRLRTLAKWMANWLTYRVLEPLGHDDNITDIYVPAPPEVQPIRVVHERWGHCETGIYWTTPSLLGLGEILASRQGKVFDEPSPQLDAEIPELGMRLFISRNPAIWPRSVAAAIRKRRSEPWTQPLFLERGMLTPLASSVVSNLIRRGASCFTIGDIGTAKTSFLETLIPEIGPHQRIICYQDTEELHVSDFVRRGYDIENVRVADSEHLHRQIDAFLRGGAAYWLITEVRETEAVKAALGAAARRGSQPVVTSFHVRTKRQMYDLVCNIMGLHEAAYKYVDLIVSTAKFDTPQGSIRRVTGVAEVLKEWDGRPEYVDLFVDDRKRDLLVPMGILKGGKHLLRRLNFYDLSSIDPVAVSKKVEFLPPEKGGSHYIPAMCQRLAIDSQDFLMSILAEARMKSDLLGLARKAGDGKYLELPFVSNAYDFYFAAAERHAPDYGQVLADWKEWLEAAR